MNNVVTRHFSKADTIGEHLHVYFMVLSAEDTCLLSMLIYQMFLIFRYYREGDENTVQYPIRGRDQALEQIHEQYVRAAEQARQHRTGCWSFPGTGSVIQIRWRLSLSHSLGTK